MTACVQVTAPSERAPAPVPVEWGVLGGETAVVVDLYDSRQDAEQEVKDDDDLSTLVAVLSAADYDRMARALALLATVDVAALDEVLSAAECWWEETAAGWDSSAVVAKIAAIRAAIEATRATTPSHPCPRCGEACVCAEWYDGDSCQHAQQVGCSGATRATQEAGR